MFNRYPRQTWNGDNIEEMIVSLGLGRIKEVSGKNITVITNEGPVVMMPGDNAALINGDVEVYSCLIAHEDFRKRGEAV